MNSLSHFHRAVGLILIAFLFTGSVFGQAPEAFKYQAVVRDGTGNLVKNTLISVRMSVLAGGAAGTAVYVESHSAATNDRGLINLNVGDGTPSSGVFANIDWSINSHYLKVEVDLNGGTNYAALGVSQLLSVPYALYSAKSGVPGLSGPTGAPGIQGPTGAQGLQGIQGTTGPQGAQGIRGVTGPIGAQGIQGIQGATGPQGIQGIRGVTGPIGAQGIQGIQGIRGVTGAVGAQGIQGPQGIRGVTGPAGAQGIQGTQGLQGLPGVAGAKGATGPTGAPGIQGVRGPTGLTGAQGIQGNQGPQGVAGVQGATGTTGPTGAQGIQGPTGAPGIQGVQGVRGPTGAQGIQGNQGPTGVHGLQGIQGTTGPQGIQGIQGPTGVQGIQGIQGSTGAQGIQGVKGVTGTQGVAGVRGATGPTGAQGPTGGILEIVFDAYSSSNTAVSTSATSVIPNFNVTNLNESSGYSTFNGRFTAPAKAIYHFDVLLIVQSTAGSTVDIYFERSIASPSRLRNIAVGTIKDGNTYLSASVNVELAVGEQVYIRCVNNTPVGATANIYNIVAGSSFSGMALYLK